MKPTEEGWYWVRPHERETENGQWPWDVEPGQWNMRCVVRRYRSDGDGELGFHSPYENRLGVFWTRIDDINESEADWQGPLKPEPDELGAKKATMEPDTYSLL